MATTPTISSLPESPNRNNDSPSTFSSKTDAFLSAIQTFQGEANNVASFSSNVAASVAGTGLAFFQNVELADTNNSDPGNGKLKFDTTTQTSASELYLDNLDVNNTSVRDLIAEFDFDNPEVAQPVKGILSLRDRQDPTKWIVFEVTDITQNTGYTTVLVQNGKGGSSSPFADADTVVVGYIRDGVDGKTFNLGGVWDSNTTYAKNDVVNHHGGAFIANQNTNAGDEPRVSSKWDRLTGDTFNARGTWDNSTAYPINDVVSHNGTGYVALQDTNAGDEPGVSSKWGVFAGAGSVVPRWKKEAEIGLAAQGGAFTVLSLPTDIDVLVFEFVSALVDVNAADLEMQISTDNGSSFVTTNTYDTEKLDIRGNDSRESDLDRWKIVTLIDDFPRGASITFRKWRLSNHQNDSGNGTLSAHGQADSRQVVSVGNDEPLSSKVNAVKFMLESGNFTNGTLRIWSA